VGTQAEAGPWRFWRRPGRDPGQESARARVPAEAVSPGDESLGGFLVLLVALSLPWWLFGGRRLPLAVDLPVSALISLNPAIAAGILTYRRGGSRGLQGLLSRAFDHRRIGDKGWYVPILLLNPLIFLLSYWIMRLTRQPLPDPVVPLRLVPVYFVLFFPFAVGEELGWMGYAIRPAQRRWGALGAGLGLGAIWAVWHLVGDVQVGNSASWILWHRLGTVGLRVLIVWLYNNTGGSVFAAVLFHDLNNVSWALFPNNASHYNPFITALLVLAAAATVTAIWGPRTLAGRGRVRQRP
jgi:membrane protease YdiL (CAAX protease family)